MPVTVKLKCASIKRELASDFLSRPFTTVELRAAKKPRRWERFTAPDSAHISEPILITGLSDIAAAQFQLGEEYTVEIKPVHPFVMT